MWAREQLHNLSCRNLPGGSDGKESTCNVGDLGSIPGLGRLPQGGHGNPFEYSGLENPHVQRSLTGYSPLGGRCMGDREGCKESDTTDQLSTHTDIPIELHY